MRILLIEDEPKLARLIAQGLEEESYWVEIVKDGKAGFHAALMGEHDLILLDLMLPGLDGLQICRKLREAKLETPILMLSARGQVQDRVQGLNLGADDYLAKPFEFDELLARVRALLRRQSKAKSTALQTGTLKLDLQAHRLTHEGVEIPLTQQEYRLLEYLLQHQGQILSRLQLAERVWEDPEVAPATIDVYISYLRQKIDKPFGTHLIQTVRGLGYRLVSPETQMDL
ncbi:DNA-binding response regulator [bacterium (Candidatus Blackallbacteria) CG17_big_fil_post_rev_8_21_14_2_50_48_46]|uniref:DNA-binding response regulator n=1 Tax=bacterium (Candidatus Blackallbacteria) CG17_big_fil_post_rev_8_21_14_2_50_48_46 TaxID=2014261 RepID=A0A2M7G6V2_9BACT|nr:MAG: DNA-binding response regulator [bacterium (Candidatus Blackallbacteria) CG18_big_fil_WC_8_21_14_2_50_49_26]PIW17772.1 MAG: DNA-binding response regulator [bacterium (Candidatus Blackallbacteria) CG17_big_fil_post_rev_8_21_14_2_50_48_46]PIW47331.1 MAG: DNA-binding response regulator [bacterium (Candidatus Blackallbacteria) CG13_big_fil_rev_8_21_14_2_50_49_14]